LDEELCYGLQVVLQQALHEDETSLSIN
jgi:hypothetical protein